MIDLDQKQEYFDWLTDQLKMPRIRREPLSVKHSNGRPEKVIANLDEHGGILCVVMYSGFSDANCELTIASSSAKWCTRQFLKKALSYPLIHLGLQRVTFVVQSDNEKSLSLCDRLGAKREGILRSWFKDDGKPFDAIVFGLLATECKWIR